MELQLTDCQFHDHLHLRLYTIHQLLLIRCCIFRLVAKVLEDAADEPDLETTIEAVTDNDPSMTEVNLNNHTKITSDHIDRLIAALEGTTQVERLSLANVKFEDSHAKVCFLSCT